MEYEVIVGNIGTVYSGDNAFDANVAFNTYVGQSKRMTGRAAGGSVTMFADGELHAEFHGDLASE